MKKEVGYLDIRDAIFGYVNGGSVEERLKDIFSILHVCMLERREVANGAIRKDAGLEDPRNPV